MILGEGPEFDRIRRFLAGPAPRRRADVRLGPGDDCAVVAGEGIALSTDLSVEDVHFRRDWLTPRQIGFRAASAALSDLAGVAARPIGLLASVGVAAADADHFAVELMAGVREAAHAVEAVLLGGDLTRSPGPVLIDVTVVGETAAPVLRSGARPGDELWVTGELGGAAAAVASLLAGEAPDEAALRAFARPAPRTREALWLRERDVARAMLDVSDGLGGDAGHLAAASGVAIVLEADRVPVHRAAAASAEDAERALLWALGGGEDYELCFAARPGSVAGVAAEFEARFGLRLTRVGSVQPGAGVLLRGADGEARPLRLGGFQHFRGS